VRILKYVLIAVVIYAISWVGAYVFINGIDQEFWGLCYQYFVLAWTFDGLERVGFTWMFSLAFFAVGFGAFLFIQRSSKKA
jgi:hypothetical protein